MKLMEITKFNESSSNTSTNIYFGVFGMSKEVKITMCCSFRTKACSQILKESLAKKEEKQQPMDGSVEFKKKKLEADPNSFKDMVTFKDYAKKKVTKLVTDKDAYDKFKHEQFLRKKQKSIDQEAELKARAIKKRTMKQYHEHIEAMCPANCSVRHFRKQRTARQKE